VVTAAGGVAVYAYLYTMVSQGVLRSTMPASVVRSFEAYTGLAYTDAGFREAAATIGAQTGLSTFVSFAAFALILFLEPPHRIFASWTPTSPDKRPALLVGALVVAFVAVLFTPALSNYFGLTGPAQPVFTSVLPTLVVWFLVLTAMFRFRVLDRLLGAQSVAI
jgi:cation-transporting ATPase E